MHTDTILDLRGINQATRERVARAYDMYGDDMDGADAIRRGAQSIHLDELSDYEGFAQAICTGQEWASLTADYLDALAHAVERTKECSESHYGWFERPTWCDCDPYVAAPKIGA